MSEVTTFEEAATALKELKGRAGKWSQANVPLSEDAMVKILRGKITVPTLVVRGWTLRLMKDGPWCLEAKPSGGASVGELTFFAAMLGCFEEPVAVSSMGVRHFQWV
jgi:hypothetical protein